MDCGSGSRRDEPRLPLAIAFLTQFAGSSDLPEVIDTAADVNWESLSMIKFRHLIWTVVAAIGLMLSASQSFAQQNDPGDQPGLIADDSVQLDPEFRRTMVLYRTTEAPGTIIIQTSERHLYVVQGNGRAIRYGIGVGRDGFQWQGLLTISRKAEWPDWTPPPEMIARQPYLPRFMAGGPGNPLGARALYLGATVYRIHGTNRPDTIGTAVSSGCFRLVNADVTDLYERIPVGTKVIVRQKPSL
jgi:lipoprotein-anchoring transpeptidase ErfK/SrfK